MLTCFELAFYGVIFPKDQEAAFSNKRLWNSLAFAVAFSYSTHLCVNVKLYIIFIFILIGVAGYVTIEICEYKKCLKKGIQKDFSSEKTDITAN